MYLNFSNFQGQTSAVGGGASLGPETGISVRWGEGLTKFLPGGRDPQSLRKKTPGYYLFQNKFVMADFPILPHSAICA